MTNVIPFTYQGESIRFNEDGWLNATDIAKRFKKRPAKWLELSTTQSYIHALAKALGKSDVRKSDFGLVATKRGGAGQGTWLHPKLAVAFGRWLDDDFAVWCDLHIDALLRGDGDLWHQLDEAELALSNQNEKGSEAGRGLANHRWKKPPLVGRVNYLRDQLQLRLSLPEAKT